MLPILSCMTETQQTEFLEEFIDATVNKERYKLNYITYMLNK